MNIIWCCTYQGIHQTTKPNRPTQLLYYAKFLHKTWAIDKITHNLFSLLANNTNLYFDYILPVPCTRSHFCLSLVLANNIASLVAAEVLPDFFSFPSKYNLSQKHIMIIDDVIMTGRTLETLQAFIHNHYKPASITAVAYLASPIFQNTQKN